MACAETPQEQTSDTLQTVQSWQRTRRDKPSKCRPLSQRTIVDTLNFSFATWPRQTTASSRKNASCEHRFCVIQPTQPSLHPIVVHSMPTGTTWSHDVPKPPRINYTPRPSTRPRSIRPPLRSSLGSTGCACGTSSRPTYLVNIV